MAEAAGVAAPARAGFWATHGRRLRKVGGAAVAVPALLLACVWAWHSVCLWNLPDVGDPFDVGAFLAQDLPAEGNAYTLYRQAYDRLKVGGTWPFRDDLEKARRRGWARPGAGASAWAERNREALELWRQGSERPAAQPPPPPNRDEPDARPSPDLNWFHDLAVLALLEGARLKEEGKEAAAWPYYRALLRSARHVQRRGDGYARLRSLSALTDFRDAVRLWAADPNVKAGDLRHALEDVQASEGLLVPDREVLQAEYLNLMRRFDEPESLEWAWRAAGRGGDAEANWARYLPGAYGAVSYFKNEPERSRRVGRLVFTHALARLEGATYERAELARAYPDLVGPAPAGALPPRLAAWKAASHLQELGTPFGLSGRNWRGRDQALVGEAAVALAEACYAREHGGKAPSPQALVGPYLPRWPEGLPPPDETPEEAARTGAPATPERGP